MLLALLAVVALSLYVLVGDQLSLEQLAQRESQWRALQQRHPLLVYAVAFLVYAGITGLSLPLATPLTLMYGWYFGWLPGIVLVSFASTTGSTLAFLLSRYFFRAADNDQFGERRAQFKAALHRDGPFSLVTLRLIPLVPFFVINAVMGLTPIATRTFWWVSQLGMLPATVVYVYAGASVPSLETLADQGVQATFTPQQIKQLLFAFALLGGFPWLVRGALRRLRPETRIETHASDAAAGREPPRT